MIEKYINIFNIHPVLKNKLVRQALSHLIPRQKICNLYNKDKDNWSHETSTEAEPCALPVFPNFWAFDERLKPYGYSHRLAKQLLSEAGYSSTTPSPSPFTPYFYVISAAIAVIVIGIYIGERGKRKIEREKHKMKRKELEVIPVLSAPSCPYCGCKVSSEDIFCSNCGKKLERIVKSSEILRKNEEINNYIVNDRGISRFALNAMFFVGLFIFGWIIGIVFYYLGKGKLGWVYALPYVILSCITIFSLVSGVTLELSGLALIIWIAGLIHANKILSHYHSVAFQRIVEINSQDTPTIDSQLEKGLILDKVMGKTQPAIEILTAALEMPGGDPLLLYLSGMIMARRKLYREATTFYDRALASTKEDALARKIKRDYASVEKHLKKGLVSPNEKSIQKCSYCGFENKRKSIFCGNCGSKLDKRGE
ncbi:MAG: hypothetical protein WBA22_11795 [Candidatus Methanofastidiosia archaeon]